MSRRVAVMRPDNLVYMRRNKYLLARRAIFITTLNIQLLTRVRRVANILNKHAIHVNCYQPPDHQNLVVFCFTQTKTKEV